jgi:hypothetical protein
MDIIQLKTMKVQNIWLQEETNILHMHLNGVAVFSKVVFNLHILVVQNLNFNYISRWSIG